MTLDKPSGGLKFVVLGGRAQGEMAAFQVGVGATCCPHLPLGHCRSSGDSAS